MARAEIRINQTGGAGVGSPGISRDDLIIASAVELRNVDNNGVTQWFWQLLDIPEGSAASLANPTSAVATFTPDVYGTYRVYLRVNDGRGRRGREAYATAIVRDPAGFREPAYLEGSESNFQLSPGVFNRVGGLHEIRRRMKAIDNRTDQYEQLAMGGGTSVDFEVDWDLPDAHVVWLEMSATASTNMRLTAYGNAARSELLYDSGAVNATVNDWFDNRPWVASRTRGNGLEESFGQRKIYFTLANNSGVATDVNVGWRIQAL